MNETIYPDIETLNDKGMSFEQVAIQAGRLRASAGDGYEFGARIGDVRGLKGWKLKVEALPDLPQYLIGQETRARYLWNFWVRHKLEKESEIFRLRDPFPRDPAKPFVFARFKEDALDFGMFCETVFQTGLEIIEQRLPYLDPNDYNSQQF